MHQKLTIERYGHTLIPIEVKEEVLQPSMGLLGWGCLLWEWSYPKLEPEEEEKGVAILGGDLEYVSLGGVSLGGDTNSFQTFFLLFKKME